MRKMLSFNDVLINPSFSDINSRKDVNISTKFFNQSLRLPVLSAPMKCVTTRELGIALNRAGGMTVLHRFYAVTETVNDFIIITEESGVKPVISLGLNDWNLLDLAESEGADTFLLDVAHGAQEQVADWYKKIRDKYGNLNLIIGNFANARQLYKFEEYAKVSGKDNLMYRVGVGGGSACLTRIKTGCGLPTLASVMDCREYESNHPIIADGGIKTPGDIAKSLAAGANFVMLGGMFAGTNETGTTEYYGSASSKAYGEQNKTQEYITAEGEQFKVPPKGPLKDVLSDIEGGLRSAFTYVGASNLMEFQNRAELVEITQSGYAESGAHGKK